MKKIIKEVDEKKGIVQVTIADERWYLQSVNNPITGIPEYKSVPSITWIGQSYPKGVGYYKWLADKGWDEAESLKQAAGDKGSKVHMAIEDILKGVEVRIDSKYLNKSTEQLEELTLEECDCILSFKRWFDEVKPEVIAWEVAVFGDKFAGTIDLICRINGEVWIIDFKTSQFVWPSHEVQVNGYKHNMKSGMHDIASISGNFAPSDYKMGILQVGYTKNKAGFKFTEIEDQPKILQAAYDIWEKEHGDEQPKKRDYPIILSSAKSAEKVGGKKLKVK